ncbi:MAG: hypothetical protein WCH11_00975 [Bdellovibrio sp.]
MNRIECSNANLEGANRRGYQEKKQEEPILLSRQKWAQNVLYPLLRDLLRLNAEMITKTLRMEAQIPSAQILQDF